MTEHKPFFLEQNTAFSTARAEDDLLHPRQNSLIKADSLTETQYFAFSVPEAAIHSFAYLWHHPNLRVVTGGLWVWRGFKHYMVQSELCDFVTYTNDSVLADDLYDYRLANGYGVKILEPLKRFHMTYADPRRGNSVDIVFEAVGPVVMFADGNHFEQPMRATGELLLRGQRYPIDCYNVRDRSWGKPRPEQHVPMPPGSWMTGVFGEDFSFTANVFDQASQNPELRGPLVLPDERTLTAGWVYRDGKLGRMLHARKRVIRAPGTLLPTELEFDAVDEFGRRMQIKGTLVASCPWQAWGNILANINLMRWECEGRVTHGNCMEAIWNDYCVLVAG